MSHSNLISAYAGDDLRAAETQALAGRPADTLMRQAAAGLARVCIQTLRDRYGAVNGRRVVLLVGSGHNGGDVLLAGALLRARGVKVDALLLTAVAYPAGLAELRRAGGALVSCHNQAEPAAVALVARTDLVVDGLVGISGRPGLPQPARVLIDAVPQGVPVIAADLPSGVDPDTGETPGPHVTADITVAFGTHSPCLLLPPAAYAAGRITLVDVGTQVMIEGLPAVRRLDAAAVGALWPVPGPTDHKYTRGVLGVVAGSDMYPGAAVLACLGAVQAGVGVVRYIGPPHVTDHCLHAAPEIVPGPGRVQAWLLGSGVDQDTVQEQAIADALASGQPCVVDAGALEQCVRQRAANTRPTSAGSMLLTPHAGELARMLQLLGHEVSREDVHARPAHHVRWAAAEADATVLLKGAATLIAHPDGRMYSQSDGPAWLATAGSGDVLAGIAGALMAAGTEALSAGAMAAFLHGRAAARASAGGPIRASAIANATPATVAEILQAAGRVPNVN